MTQGSPLPGSFRQRRRAGTTWTAVSLWGYNFPWDGGWYDEEEGDSGSGSGGALAGEIFSDREVYRPGHLVHLKGILRVRTTKGYNPCQSASVRVTVTDSHGKEILTTDAALSEFGTFNCDVQLADGVPLGRYRVRAAVEGAVRTLGGFFRVEEYRPVEFEAKIEPLVVGENAQGPSGMYAVDDDFYATLSGKYLFGAPMKGAAANWTAWWENEPFRPAGFDDFEFGENVWYGRYHYERSPLDRELAAGAGTLDDDGKLVIEFPLKLRGRTDGALTCNVAADIEDASGASVSVSRSVTVHPADFYIGVAADSNVMAAGKPAKIRLACVKPDGTTVDGVSCTVNVTRREWRTVLKKVAGGGEHYVNETFDEPVSESRITVGGEGFVYEFTPSRTGCCIIEISAVDSRGRSVNTSVEKWAWGSEYINWYRRDDVRIDLVPDKAAYSRGDTAKILVKSPWQGVKGLLTVESTGVISQRIVDISSTAEVFEIPVTNEMLPNAYVSLVMVRGRTTWEYTEAAVDKGRPKFRVGYAELTVRSDDRKLNVSVSPDKASAQPGETVNVSLCVTDAGGAGCPAEITFWAADEGVLKLVGYRTPDPHAAVFMRNPLGVRTHETREIVLGRTPFDEFGNKCIIIGDGAGMASSYRAFFTACPVWEASVLTDKDGRATVSFKLPDNLTRFRLMAVAVTKADRFGSGESSVEVRKPLLVRPALPRFANVGDAFAARASVHNDTDAEIAVTVQFAVEGACRAGSACPLTFKIPARSQEIVEFLVTALETGPATFLFTAKAQGMEDSVKVTIPVRSPLMTEKAVVAGRTDSTVTKTLMLPKPLVRDTGFLEVELSANGFAELDEGIDFLVHYPYGCIEQTSSATLALIMAKRVAPERRFESLGDRSVDDSIRYGIARIFKKQTDRGGFGFWESGDEPEDWLTAYAVHVLLLARRAGFEVDDARLKEALDFLSGLLRTDAPGAEAVNDSTRAYAVYVLALAGRPEDAYMAALSERGATLGRDGRALLALAQAASPSGSAAARATADELTGGAASARAEYASLRGAYYSMVSSVCESALVLMAACRAMPASPKLDALAQKLLATRRGGRWMSTHENAVALLALTDYLGDNAKGKASFSATASLGGVTVLEAQFSGTESKPVFFRMPMSNVAKLDGKPLSISKQGDGALFYRVRLCYATSSSSTEATDNGIGIARAYEPLEEPDKPHLQGVFAVGELVRVRLRITVPERRAYVVIDDPIPAGFEVVNTEFTTENPILEGALNSSYSEHAWRDPFDYTERRDDRVVVFATELEPGVYEHCYLLRGVAPGRFSMPSARAEEMYAPDCSGSTEMSQVTVTPGR
jgi:uncharacterized protein YfaS (alpha-2-macroglobulin family)